MFRTLLTGGDVFRFIDYGWDTITNIPPLLGSRKEIYLYNQIKSISNQNRILYRIFAL